VRRLSWTAFLFLQHSVAEWILLAIIVLTLFGCIDPPVKFILGYVLVVFVWGVALDLYFFSDDDRKRRLDL
jgi:hypothetical protein